MADVVGFAEEHEWGGAGHVIVVFADKEEDVRAFLVVVDVALAGWGFFGGGALALPVEQPLVDRIVVVHGCRGVVLGRLVERVNEDVGLLVLDKENALADGFRLHVIHRDEDLVTGVVAVEIER